MLEDHDLIKSIRLKNISAFAIHGRLPGEVWTVEIGNDGNVVNALWAKRIADEHMYKLGALLIEPIEDAAPAALVAAYATIAPPAASLVISDPPAFDLGPLLSLIDNVDQRLKRAESTLSDIAADLSGPTSRDLVRRIETLESLLSKWAAGEH
jgi:hypothetical protein